MSGELHHGTPVKRKTSHLVLRDIKYVCQHQHQFSFNVTIKIISIHINIYLVKENSSCVHFKVLVDRNPYSKFF